MAEKQTLDKTKLQANITKVQELLDKVNKEKAPASTLAAIQADLENAKNALNNNELTQAEVDAVAKTLSDKLFILSSMPKLGAPEKVVKEGKNTIANTGTHDSRNGLNMGEGSDLRSANVSSTWTSKDNLLSYQRFRASDGSGNARNDDRQFTENKVDMTARIETIDGSKYVVYDVFFNNDGRAMARLSTQQVYRVILPPKILDLQSSGAYKSDTIRNLYFDIYRRKSEDEGGTLSQNPEKFNKESTWSYHFLNDHDKSKGQLTYFYNLGVRAGASHAQDMSETFKANRNDSFLEKAVKLEGVYSGYSYGLGVRTNDKTAAVHMHLEAKLRSGVSDEDVRKAFTVAVAGTYGKTTNQSYVFGSGKEDSEQVEPTVKQSVQYPIKGKEVTKTVGDSLGDVSKPVASGFVVRNDDTKDFPDGMRWNWTNGQPSTSAAGIFKYNVTATYSDNSSNSTTATLKVNPKKPTITARDVEHKKGLTGQSITVNVGSGVKAGSTVKLYDGNAVIGTGTTNGETATVVVSGALSGNPITAETIVNNGGEVTSARSEAVTPTEVPDSVAPTVSFNHYRSS